VRGGKPFDKCSLHALLCNPVYIGMVRHKTEVYPGEHEAIVEKALFEQVQNLMQKNARCAVPLIRDKHGALLRGLMFCKGCDRTMVHTFCNKGGRLKYRYYTCTAAIKEGRRACPSPSLPVGQLIRAALDAGVERILVGCGDSGTNDAGAGAAQALGVRLLDRDGHDLGPGGGELLRLARIELADRDRRLERARLEVACNWSVTLATVTRWFGPQKGADTDRIRVLEAALERFAEVVERDLGVDLRNMPGGRRVRWPRGRPARPTRSDPTTPLQPGLPPHRPRREVGLSGCSHHRRRPTRCPDPPGQSPRRDRPAGQTTGRASHRSGWLDWGGGVAVPRR